ncbi:two pore domain potassium channel family protein [Alcaligenaceae bacterium]|nr:two pore domain potassium channel family protein [Alcaligenaceae bacterium]
MAQVVITNIVVVLAAVLTHFESLRFLSWVTSHIQVRPHLKLILCVCGVLLAHTIEVWLFALAYFFMQQNRLGSLLGSLDGSLMDCVYFSFTTFTTLGFGDINPLGLIRYLTGLEALTGLVLITWSASFLFVEMEKYWKRY